MEQDRLVFDSSMSNPENMDIQKLVATGVTNASGEVTLGNITHGNYTIEVEETETTSRYSEAVLIDSSTLNIEVQPIYSVTVTSNAKNSKVEFIASDKVRRVENTGDNTSVTFTEIPAGEYSITISEETHQTLNSSGVINEPIDLKYSLSKVPKLVQIDSDYESYLLDTAYNYVDIMDNFESVATIDLKSISSISIIDNTVKYSNNELTIKGTLSLHYYD